MTTFQINKINDVTIMPNHHLKNKELSLDAKGTLAPYEETIHELIEKGMTAVEIATEIRQNGCITPQQFNKLCSEYPFFQQIYNAVGDLELFICKISLMNYRNG